MPLFSRPRPGTIDEGRPACARSASRRSGAPVAARLEADRHLAQQAWVATLSGAGSDLPLSTLTEAQCVLFVEEARRHQLSGLRYRALLERQKIDGAPQRVLDGLRPAYVETALRNAVFFSLHGQDGTAARGERHSRGVSRTARLRAPATASYEMG
jgi:hypothetical protein